MHFVFEFYSTDNKPSQNVSLIYQTNLKDCLKPKPWNKFENPTQY